ncbi:MAG: vitamin K epoxide reductase family protein [Dehalococcoidia bacterium]|nr:vitamin K epoxide reductase family protein [Dehalococcoidia bacterium]
MSSQSLPIEPRGSWRVGPRPLAIIAALALAVVGVGVAAYLAVENMQGQSGVCVIAQGCQQVQQSQYGKILGVPVSIPGLALYSVLVLAAIAWLKDFRGQRPVAMLVGFYGSFAGVLFSGYLTYLEAFVLDAWCIYCIVSALLMAGLFLLWGTVFALTLRDARREAREYDETWD